MTAKTRTLTLGLENMLILRKYPDKGFVPCKQCEQRIQVGRKIVIREASGKYQKSAHYCFRCARRIALI